MTFPGPRDGSLEGPTVRNFRRTRSRRVEGERAVSNAITRFSGSMTFVVVHVIWFTSWIVVNQVVPDGFDPFPYGLLTLIVSLEAIFLSTFLLISQNQQSAESDQRSLQDFQTNVYAEVLSELIGEHLGISQHDVAERYKKRMGEAQRADDAAPS